ncbi:protein of unknown function [Hyphomicrobium sp. MC1]|nr:protein of unknown function [Hyphomicrobium sp. MC1]
MKLLASPFDGATLNLLVFAPAEVGTSRDPIGEVAHCRRTQANSFSEPGATFLLRNDAGACVVAWLR